MPVNPLQETKKCPYYSAPEGNVSGRLKRHVFLGGAWAGLLQTAGCNCLEQGVSGEADPGLQLSKIFHLSKLRCLICKVYTISLFNYKRIMMIPNAQHSDCQQVNMQITLSFTEHIKRTRRCPGAGIITTIDKYPCLHIAYHLRLRGWCCYGEHKRERGTGMKNGLQF